MTRLLLTGLLALCGVSAAATQSPPSFSGTWTLDKERSESAHQAQPVGQVTVVIVETDRTITIETRRDGSSQTVPYRRDGSKLASRIAGQTVTSQMQWDGPRLITEAVYDMKGFPVTTREIRSLSADGTEMVVQSLVRVEHGYLWNFSRENPPHYGEGKDVYVRVSR